MKTKNKKVARNTKVYILCFVTGFIIAVIFYNSLNKAEINSIINSIKVNQILFKPLNNSIIHLKILSVILLLSFIYIGFVIFLGLLISEGFKIFLRIIFLSKIYHIKGFFYGTLYTLINYGLYIYLLIFFYKKIIKICINIYKKNIKKENLDYVIMYKYLIKSIIIILTVFLTDFIIYLYGNNLISIIRNICKI